MFCVLTLSFCRSLISLHALMLCMWMSLLDIFLSDKYFGNRFFYYFIYIIAFKVCFTVIQLSLFNLLVTFENIFHLSIILIAQFWRICYLFCSLALHEKTSLGSSSFSNDVFTQWWQRKRFKNLHQNHCCICKCVWNNLLFYNIRPWFFV